MRDWRFLLDPPASGVRHMAADEALLESVRAGLAPPTLRLYCWDRPTVSLGRTQAVERAGRRHLPALPEAWPVVVRPTGGRALLHGAGDLTYAVAIPDDAGFPADVRGMYCSIARWLSRALARVGLEGSLQQGSTAPGPHFDCLAVATEADLVVRGMKRVASAQLRRPGGTLQHGAVWLDSDPVMLESLLSGSRLPPGLPGPGHERLTAVGEALVIAARELWGVSISPGAWQDHELATVEHLVRQVPSSGGA
ncbi:MAG: biotin/lipoate A/B protein ligase family protein [bacterium]|nr:biotin/lipoate A/B protein ligase family protein [bacterium]